MKQGSVVKVTVTCQNGSTTAKKKYCQMLLKSLGWTNQAFYVIWTLKRRNQTHTVANLKRFQIRYQIAPYIKTMLVLSTVEGTAMPK